MSRYKRSVEARGSVRVLSCLSFIVCSLDVPNTFEVSAGLARGRGQAAHTQAVDIVPLAGIEPIVQGAGGEPCKRSTMSGANPRSQVARSLADNMMCWCTVVLLASMCLKNRVQHMTPGVRAVLCNHVCLLQGPEWRATVVGDERILSPWAER